MSAPPKQRADALVSGHREKLREALSLTSFITVQEMVPHYLAHLNKWERRLSQDPEWASLAIDALGANGLGPGIIDVLRSARFHAERYPAEAGLGPNGIAPAIDHEHSMALGRAEQREAA